jgi:hypothetical protein
LADDRTQRKTAGRPARVAVSLPPRPRPAVDLETRPARPARPAYPPPRPDSPFRNSGFTHEKSCLRSAHATLSLCKNGVRERADRWRLR